MDLEQIKAFVNDMEEYSADHDIFEIITDIKILLFARSKFEPQQIARLTKSIFNNRKSEIGKIYASVHTYKLADTKNAKIMELNSFVLEWLTKLLCEKAIEQQEPNQIQMNYGQDLADVIEQTRQAINMF